MPPALASRPSPVIITGMSPQSSPSPPPPPPVLPGTATCLPPSPVKPPSEPPASPAAGSHHDAEPRPGLGCSLLRWAATLLAGAGMLSVVAAAAAAAVAFAGGSSVSATGSWGFWSAAMALMALTIALDASVAGCTRTALALAFGFKPRRAHRCNSSNTQAAVPSPITPVAAGDGGGASSTRGVLVATTLCPAPPSTTGHICPVVAAAKAASLTIDLAALHETLQKRRRAAALGAAVAGGKGTQRTPGGSKYCAQLNHVSVAAKVRCFSPCTAGRLHACRMQAPRGPPLHPCGWFTCPSSVPVPFGGPACFVMHMHDTGT